MADCADCFSIGSTVACLTCFKQHIEGEVLAFDQQTKMLILKCEARSGSMELNDVFIVNLSLCSDVQVKKEVSTKPDPPQSLNLQRLSTRVRNTVEEKKRLVTALAAGVSPEGQRLFLAISKTIKEVHWSGPNLVVMDDVIIAPPYKVDNVSCTGDSRKLSYVKKIVEKYTKDQATSSASSPTASAAPIVSAN